MLLPIEYAAVAVAVAVALVGLAVVGLDVVDLGAVDLGAAAEIEVEFHVVKYSVPPSLPVACIIRTDPTGAEKRGSATVVDPSGW